MIADYTSFVRFNVVDSCSILNVVSSGTLYAATATAGCALSITEFVFYESCIKKINRQLPANAETIRSKVSELVRTGELVRVSIDLADLQDPRVAGKTSRHSMGELSTMIFAKKAGLAFMSDDGKAQRLAKSIEPSPPVQTTPHLLGWLVYTKTIDQNTAELCVREHRANGRDLEKQLTQCITEAIGLSPIAPAPQQPQS